MLARTVVGSDNPSVVPYDLPLTHPHGVSVPLQLIHPDRGLAELPTPNDGEQLRPSGVYMRLTSKHNRVSNPLNRGRTGTVTRDFSLEHPFSDGGLVTANLHLQPLNAYISQTITAPPHAVFSDGESLPSA